IVTMREYVDEENNKFFVRVVCSGQPASTEELLQDLKDSLPDNAVIQLNPSNRKRIAVLVTKEHHCLADILTRHYFDTLQGEVVAVIGNYDILKNFTEKFDVPFHHISHEHKDKAQFEK